MSALRTIADYAAALTAVLPRGRVWPESGAPVWSQLIDAIATEFRRLDARALQLIEEADPRTCTEALEDWERILGLPDPCSPANASFDERRAAVVAQLRAQGGASKAYFIAIAEALGFEITITEHRPFVCGRSPCGYQTNRQEIGSPSMRLVWTVRPQTRRPIYFRIGHGGSQAGRDPLVQFERAEQLECLFQRLKPAHTRVVFDYSSDGIGGGIGGGFSRGFSNGFRRVQ